jgi:hypothetical protein
MIMKYAHRIVLNFSIGKWKLQYTVSWPLVLAPISKLYSCRQDQNMCKIKMPHIRPLLIHILDTNNLSCISWLHILPLACVCLSVQHNYLWKRENKREAFYRILRMLICASCHIIAVSSSTWYARNNKYPNHKCCHYCHCYCWSYTDSRAITSLALKVYVN